MSKKIIVNQYWRDNKGRFKNKKITIYFYLSLILLLLVGTFIGTHWNKKQIQFVPVDRIVIKDTAYQIIEREKNSLLDDLSACECPKNITDENCIVFEDGGTGKSRQSWGRYMFKISTIQNYKKGLTDWQAINLAMNPTQARALASYIIFETKSGVKTDWINCTRIKGLQLKLDFIKQLEQKIK